LDKIDVELMINPEEIAKEKVLFDSNHNGIGKIMKVWYCQEGEKTELDASELTNFFSKER